jgi:hypothetical protein
VVQTEKLFSSLEPPKDIAWTYFVSRSFINNFLYQALNAFVNLKKYAYFENIWCYFYKLANLLIIIILLMELTT